MPLPSALVSPLSRLVLAAGCVVAVAPGAARAAAGEHAATPGARFDRLFAQIDSAKLNTPDEASQRDALLRLRRLVPPGDARRELYYRTQACYAPGLTPEQAMAVATRGVADARRLGEPAAQVRFLYCQASYSQLLDAPQASLARVDAGIALARRIHDARQVADGLSLRSDLHSLMGQQAQALMDVLAAQRTYDTAGLTRLAEWNLQSIASIYRRMGEHDQALRYLRRSRAVAVRDGDWSLLLGTEMQRAFVLEDEHPAQALAAYARALDIARRHGSRSDAGYARLAMAYPHLLLGHHERVLALLRQAEADFAAAGDHSNAGMVALRHGQALAGLGRHVLALSEFHHAARVLEPSGNDRYLDMLYPSRAATYEALGNPAAALVDYRRYMAVHEKLRKQVGDQQALLMRYRVDANTREFENRRLVAEKAARDRQVATLLQARRWQVGALVLGAMLVALLVGLTIHQFARMRRLRAMAHTDALTGVANRRRVELFGERAIARAHGLRQPLAALTFDIDHFKAINDSHGHGVGDQVLARVARACQGALRQGDLIGRTGGEEFVVVLPDADPEFGAQIAERLRTSVEQLALEDLAPGLRVSISIGLARLRREDSSLSHLTRRADRAMYEAKRQGRNRIEVEQEEA